MVNALGLREDGGYVELSICPSCQRKEYKEVCAKKGTEANNSSIKIETVESYEQAIEKGWRKANHPRLSSRKKKEWFCPSCIKELMPILLEQK